MAIALLILALSFVGGRSEQTITVNTDLGPVTGLILQSDGGNDYRAFRGIPYAKPPIKNLRFQNPEPAEAWNGTLDATEVGFNCIQMNIFNQDLEGDEDCLYLNVYVPRSVFKIDGSLASVMVYIHGGGFASGTGDQYLTGPERFMDKDVILVTFNYRLGPFGFLSTDDEIAPGNYGLLDQVLALKWVQQHISSFGGDPNSVTIFGESSGSACVSYHVLSPLSRGLFHAAIQQSGNALSEWAFEASPEKMTAKIATALNCSSEPSTELIKCLRKRPALNIIMTMRKAVMDQSLVEQSFIIYRPVVDASRGADAFLPLKPIDQLLKGNVNVVPILSGLTKDEGMLALMMMSRFYGGIRSNIHNLVSRVFPVMHPNLFRDPKRGNDAIEKVISYYLKSEDNMSLNEKLLAFIQIFTGEWMKSADDYNELLTKLGAPVYPFVFTYRGNQSIQEIFPEYSNLPNNFMDDFEIVSHGDDLQYLFHCSYFKNQTLSGNDTLVSEQLLTLWTDFAKTKRPTEGTEWVPMQSGQPTYYDIDLESKPLNGSTNPYKKLWDEIYGTEVDDKTEL